MSTQPRQPKGTRTGGEFAERARGEATGGVDVLAPPSAQDADGSTTPAHFNWNTETASHVTHVVDAIDRSWENGHADIDSVYAEISAELERRGIEVPSRLDILFNPKTSDMALNRWPEGTPDTVPVGDVWSEPGTLTWKGAGFTPADARRWETADVYEPSVARALSDEGMSVEDAAVVYEDRGGGWTETVGRAACFGEITPAQAKVFVEHARESARHRVVA